MKKLYQIKLKSDTKNLEVIADFIKDILKKKNIDQEIIKEILISVDEAATNIVNHSYKGRKDGDIKVVLYILEDKIVVSIFDSGVTFEPDKVPLPVFTKNIAKRALGGLGVFLMNQFMDEVTFHFKGRSNRDQNEVKMVKYI